MDEATDERSSARRERGELQQRITDWLDVPLTVLAFASLGLLIVELVADFGPAWTGRVEQAQTAIWVIFVAAFLFELALAPSKVAYLKRNWLTAVSVALPAFRSLRVLRVARAVRGLRLFRIITSLNRGTRALGSVARRGQLGYVLLLTLVVTVTSGAGAYFFERTDPNANILNPGDALWWAAAIVTTINSPYETITFEGRVLALLLRVFALSISGYLTAIIAVYLLGDNQSAESPEADGAELRRLRIEVARLRALLEHGPAHARLGAPDEEAPAHGERGPADESPPAASPASRAAS